MSELPTPPQNIGTEAPTQTPQGLPNRPPGVWPSQEATDAFARKAGEAAEILQTLASPPKVTEADKAAFDQVSTHVHNALQSAQQFKQTPPSSLSGSETPQGQ